MWPALLTAAASICPDPDPDPGRRWPPFPLRRDCLPRPPPRRALLDGEVRQLCDPVKLLLAFMSQGLGPDPSVTPTLCPAPVP